MIPDAHLSKLPDIPHNHQLPNHAHHHIDPLAPLPFLSNHYWLSLNWSPVSCSKTPSTPIYQTPNNPDAQVLTLPNPWYPAHKTSTTPDHSSKSPTSTKPCCYTPIARTPWSYPPSFSISCYQPTPPSILPQNTHNLSSIHPVSDTSS